MKINHIRLQRFGCFADRQVRFEPGLNIIKGPNEVGKSTLQQALMMALLERPRQIKATQPYRAWGADHWYCLSVEFDADEGGSWLLVKDFENNSQDLSDPNGLSIKSPDQVQSIIEQMLGTASPNIFKSTVCVAQDALNDISAGRKEISQSLEQIITGGDEDVYTSSAIKALEGKVREYKKGYLTHAPVSPGPIGRLQAQHEELSNKVRQYQGVVRDWEQAEDDQRQAEARLRNIETEYAPRVALLEEAKKAKELQTEREKWLEQEEALESRIEKITEAEQTMSAARRHLIELKPVSVAKEDDVQSIARLQERVDVLRGEKEKVDAQREKMLAEAEKRPKQAPRPNLMPPGLTTTIGIMGFLFGIVLLILLDNPTAGLIFAGLGILAGGAGLVWLLLVYLRFQQSSARPTPVIPPEFDDTELTAAETELNTRLNTLDCDNGEELETKWKQVQSYIKQYDSAKIQLKTLIPEGKTKEELEEERKHASRERRDVDEKLEEPEVQRAVALDAISIQKLETEKSALEVEKSELENSLNRLAGKLEETSVTREDLQRAEEQLAAVDVDLERAKQRLAIYEMALEVMQVARTNTLKRAQDELAPRMGGYLEKLTLGRFSEVEVGSNLNIRVRHPKNLTTMVTPERLSTGTQDQLYMAARLALIDLLFQDAKPPIFLDDPFVKFDPQRRVAAVELVQQIAEDRQVLLFTCSNEYDLAGNVIELQG